jgi:hypothetical protein
LKKISFAETWQLLGNVAVRKARLLEGRRFGEREGSYGGYFGKSSVI